MNRRHFIQRMSATSLLLGTGSMSMEALTGKPEITKLTILHTNDVHSRVDPFPMDGSRDQGMGGVARRAALIKKVRAEEKNVLLLDAGDIFQGTPYFNFFGGELELKLMSEMGYDASTIGNHDFDNGIDGLYKQLPNAKFPILIANYDFSNTVMKGKTQPYKIFKKDGVKIGVFGIGIELKSLVSEKLYKDTVYQDPVPIAAKIASQLKNDEKCDYVICLSHLGYKYDGGKESGKICDVKLADQSSNIDLIIGGHTHTFLKEPDIRKNADGKPVIVNQVGWAGLMMGRFDVYFEKNKSNRCETCSNIKIGGS
jgi:5'-nucleotidase